MLGDRPKAGEGHPSLPPVDLRLERSKLEASLSRRLRTDLSPHHCMIVVFAGFMTLNLARRPVFRPVTPRHHQ